ncbi:PIN domain-containing protein [Nodularia sp. UHCC 0506]|uniref:PIN domain-containing protein n=1 Tax=Nodularia sp. UHCC 0506 TaxID=3110243 RepID=UPI002B1E93DD|nr:PIN domain-containing protein [Nodularia sp. UHCC 0506]MEA5512473.1 PIN domain-containing protein [Nodularia sp. UHCC 0506]
MTDKIFLDTNLWIYLYAKNPPKKSQQVAEILKNNSSLLLVSTQILGELFHVLTRKKFTSKADAITIISDIVNTFLIQPINTTEVIQALEINAKYHYSYWDSLIIATALINECSIIYSEDMQHNQLIENKVRIINPLV